MFWKPLLVYNILSLLYYHLLKILLAKYHLQEYYNNYITIIIRLNFLGICPVQYVIIENEQKFWDYRNSEDFHQKIFLRLKVASSHALRIISKLYM